MSSRQNSPSKGKGSSRASRRLQNKTPAKSVYYFLDDDEENWTDQFAKLSPGGVDSKKEGASLPTPVTGKKTGGKLFDVLLYRPTTRRSERRRPSEASPSAVQGTQRGKLPSQGDILVEEEITFGTDDNEPIVDGLVEADDDAWTPPEEADDEIDDDEITADGFVDLEDDDEALPGDRGQEEEEEEDDNDDDDDDDDADQAESSRPSKKQRVQTDETAEDWIRRCNETNPVPDSDRDLKRFQRRMKSLIDRQVHYARSDEDGTIDAWMKKQRGDREMTRGFRSLLLNMDPQTLADNVLGHMPRLTQKLLGQGPDDMDPTSLLAMPEVPGNFLHRLTYLDIPVRVGAGNIVRRPSKFVRSRVVKSIATGIDVDPSMESMIYVGSTLYRKGGWHRLQTHEKESNRGPGHSLHYGFSGQHDVVSNFRVAGVWSNPYVLQKREDVNQDVERWLPVYLEGLLMIYLGTYHRKNRLHSEKLKSLFSEASYELADKMREGLQLPDLHNHSLNRAWPLMQGVPGGMATAIRCANPACQRPTGDGETTCAEFVGRTKTLIATDGPLSDRVCGSCHQFLKK
ncbi:hypothetical protein CDV31_007519 [Fusarium ambrosium]|uniref:Uncharacterized protein n=1 Tax=Fusarium ambrosium TaxID=131363 RepID=A0A428U605_9HYPO|nr:hypothetical protein CDV31_007519 [Fusarium ambrosium]